MDLVQSYWWVSGSDPPSAEGSSGWGMTPAVALLDFSSFSFYIQEWLCLYIYVQVLIVLGKVALV